MEETRVTFETAKLAKEKGFNWKCRGKVHCSHYHLIKNNIIPSNIPTSHDDMFAPLKDWNNHLKPKLDTETSLPTQSLLQKWLREVHNIYISIFVSKYTGKVVKEYSILIRNFNINDGEKSLHEQFLIHDEALEYGLQQALKLI